MKKKIKHLTFLFCFVSLFTFAQDTDEALETRSSISAQVKVNKRIKSKISLGYRTTEGINTFSSILFEPSLKYKVKKTNYTFGLGYRYQYKLTTPKQRIEFSGNWDDKIVKRTYLDLGVKYQYDYDIIGLKAWAIRPKITLEHKIKKTKLYPWAAIELFYKNKYNYKGINTVRSSLGLKYKVSKQHTVALSYLRQWDEIRSDAYQTNIIQFAYKINLK